MAGYLGGDERRYIDAEIGLIERIARSAKSRRPNRHEWGTAYLSELADIDFDLRQLLRPQSS